MQPWDQVMGIAGDINGLAGLVQAVDGDHATVKFDTVESPVSVAIADLKLLGR